MPPRFVEIPNPLLDGVEWAGTQKVNLASVAALLLDQLPEVNLDALHDKFCKHFNQSCDGITAIPKPCGLTVCTIVAAVSLAVLRVLMVKSQTSKILRTHGHSHHMKCE